ncbi:MAG: hypothetical protein KDB27_34830 [Planctomycetales bacterium]|nr:hypothetical protein [Planctomycetales bacterium]
MIDKIINFLAGGNQDGNAEKARQARDQEDIYRDEQLRRQREPTFRENDSAGDGNWWH